jgi:hypothetical protein
VSPRWELATPDIPRLRVPRCATATPLILPEGVLDAFDPHRAGRDPNSICKSW